MITSNGGFYAEPYFHEERIIGARPYYPGDRYFLGYKNSAVEWAWERAKRRHRLFIERAEAASKRPNMIGCGTSNELRSDGSE